MQNGSAVAAVLGKTLIKSAARTALCKCRGALGRKRGAVVGTPQGHLGAMLTDFLISIGARLERGANSDTLFSKRKSLSKRLPAKSCGVYLGREGTSPVRELGAASTEAVQALRSLGLSAGTA